jgi:hypothetical protein
MQLMQGFMVAVGHKFCIVFINFNVVSLLFDMHSKLWQFICVVCIRDFFFQFCEPNKMREHMQKKNTKFSGNCTGKNRNNSKNFQKKLLLQCKILAKKRNSSLHAILRMFSPYYICMPSFDKFMLRGFHAILIVFFPIYYNMPWWVVGSLFPPN